ncbi:hypothetical protein BIU82_18350 [Arthrobacter sp. SW1]|nr:hypothetical protein BIU82_18350 [Arthrobacter sp. SW1]
MTATTDENGAYLFEGLQLGGYVVEFAGLPQGASFSPAGAGDDTTVDSDAGENGRSAVVTLTADAPAAVVDAGVVGAPAPTEPTVTVDPSTVHAGDDTQVTGQGFAPNSPVEVQLVDPAGNPVGDPVAVTTDGEGNFTTPLTVPEGSAPGEYSVEAVDGEGGEDSTTLAVTPEDGEDPTVTVDPSAVAPGNATTVTGEGFAPNSPVTVQLVDSEGNPVGEPVEVTTDENGNFTTPLTVPEGTTPGDYAVVATDDEGNEAESPLTVIEAGSVDPSIAADPAVVQQGGTTQVTGDGYSPNADVKVELLNAAGAAIVSLDTTSNADGAISETLVVPADAAVASTYKVRGTDAPTQLTAETGLQVTAASISSCEGNPSLTVVPSKVEAGGSATLMGKGYTKGETLTIKMVNSAGTAIEVDLSGATAAAGNGFTVVVGDNCSFIAKITVPKGTAAGDYEVVATDKDGKEKGKAPLEVTISVDPGSSGNNGGNGSLPNTGAQVLGVSVLALLLLAGGALTMVAVRMRSRRS